MRARRRHLPGLLALALLAASAVAASAQEVVAVLGSDSGPYREALAGLEHELDRSVPAFYLSRAPLALPPEALIVVAFGSKAALRAYPDRVRVVYVMAAAAAAEAPRGVKVCMAPAAAKLLADLTRIQPGLKRLGVMWASAGFEDYLSRLRAAAKPLGLTVVDRRAAEVSEVPDGLRGLHESIDGLWLPPDPLLLTAGSMAMFRDYAVANRVPLYVPTAGLVSEEATASVGVSFWEMGRLAGLAAARALKGLRQESMLFPEKTEIVISRSAAAQTGLPLSDAILREADRVLP